MESENSQYEKENDLAVSILDQQKAALYGVASALVATGLVPHKKRMKKVVKKLRREVKASIGPDGSEELLMSNKAAVEGSLKLLKGSTTDKSDQRKLLTSVVEEWYGRYTRGLKNLGWESSI